MSSIKTSICRKAYYGLNMWNAGLLKFQVYEIDIDKQTWKQILVPLEEFGFLSKKNQGLLTSIKGQLYLFSISSKNVYYLDPKNNTWQLFERDGNITNILTILPYQA